VYRHKAELDQNSTWQTRTTSAPTSSLSFYRPDALPAAQPTLSEH